MHYSNKQIKEVDLNDMQAQIASLYNQMEDSVRIINDFKEENSSYKNIINNYNKILIIGMGGSAIGADFARTIIANNLSMPIFIIRDYSIPAWVDKKTFVIASSYSGNTEETLAAYNECVEKGCHSIVISTGGKLSECANRNNVGVVKLPVGYQPRAAIGYSLSVLLLLFVELGLAENKILTDLKQSIDNKLGIKYIEEAKVIASKLYKTFPVIYSSQGYMEILSVRLKGQLAENAKILSYYEVFPEHNHNEIEGWSNSLTDLTSQFSVVWIKDKSDSSYIKKRMEIVENIISKFPNQQLDIEVSGDTVLERVFTMIHVIDWTSFYLAILYKNNPSPVDNIKKLKSLMLG